MNILLIESDSLFADEIKRLLEKEKYKVLVAESGVKALSMAFSHQLDIIIMERIMPDMDGIVICKELLLRHDVPLIILSNTNDRNDKILCIGTGAYDYIEKPIWAADIAYMVRTIIHNQENQPMKNEKEILEYKDTLKLDVENRIISICAVEASFTMKETEIIELFLRHKNEVLSKCFIHETIWKEPEYYDTGYVSTYINRIRNKLNEYDLDPIKTIRLKGYKWEDI